MARPYDFGVELDGAVVRGESLVVAVEPEQGIGELELRPRVIGVKAKGGP